MPDPLPVAMVWHHHQPQCRDLAQDNPRGALRLPWVRLHALSDYYGMAAQVSQYPGILVTFNFTPVLLEQLQAYALESVTDAVLELTLAPAERLTTGQRQQLSERFFVADWHHQIYPHTRYAELLRRRLNDDLGNAQDCRDLQMWFNLAWFAEHARLQADGGIEISTSPYAHPSCPASAGWPGAVVCLPLPAGLRRAGTVLRGKDAQRFLVTRGSLPIVQEGPMERTRCHVEHLWFEHSDVGLRRQLGSCGGIESVDVDPLAEAVTVEFDESRLDAAAVRRLISSCGYECAPADAADIPIRE